ncbi:ABC transporter substrate-binding protein [Pseudoroseicyclus sp. H15]
MRLNSLMASLAAGVSVVAMAPAFAETPADTLVIADAIDDVITLDPHEVGEIGGVLVSTQVYQTLVTVDVNDATNIMGVLADSWEISDDGLTYTFHMNPEATFASGNPVTAEDAAYSFHRIVKMDGRTAFIITQFGFTPENVEERVVALDDETLQITIDEAYAPSFFLVTLSSYVGAIVEKAAVQEHEVDGDFGNAWLKTGEESVGSGPFTLAQWDPSVAIVMERNENYWGDAPEMNRIVLRHVAESATQRLLLEQGDIDIANKLSPDDHAALADNPDVETINGPSSVIYYMGMNEREEPLGNPQVIEAMKYLIDYQGMADTLAAGTVKVHQTMIPEGFLGAVDYNPYSYDLERAQELLEESGVELPIELDIVVWNNAPYTDFAQALQATMAPAGIELNLEVVDGGQWLDRYRNHDLDGWMGLWGPDYPDPHSNAKAFAVTAADSPDGVDTLADRFGFDPGELSPRTMAAVREQDASVRQSMYEEIQREHTDISPFLYMFQEQRAIGVRAGLEGLTLGVTFADDRYWNVTK